MRRQILVKLTPGRLDRLFDEQETHQLEQPLAHQAVLTVEIARIGFAQQNLVGHVGSDERGPLLSGDRHARKLLPRAGKAVDDLAGDGDGLPFRRGSDRIGEEQERPEDGEMQPSRPPGEAEEACPEPRRRAAHDGSAITLAGLATAGIGTVRGASR